MVEGQAEQQCTHRCEFVTVSDVEDLSIKGNIRLIVEILPMPDIADVILRQPLSLDKFTLWHARVLSNWLDDSDAVILQIVVDHHWPHSIELLRRLVDSLFEVGVESKHLLTEWPTYRIL